MPDVTVEVVSTNGELEIDPNTGVIRVNNFKDGTLIPTKFDVEEWHKFYPNDSLANARTINILDIGYWYMRDQHFGYEPPREDFRNQEITVEVVLTKGLRSRIEALAGTNSLTFEATLLKIISHGTTLAETDDNFFPKPRCQVCHVSAPLVDGECPNCRH